MNRYTPNARLIVFVAAILGPAYLSAAPSVSDVEGEIAHGGQVQISGGAFGPKSPAKPYFWAPMDGSLNPSPLGIATAWSEVQNMSFAAGEGPAGGGSMKATNGSGVWTGRVDASGFYWSDPGQKMYIFRKLKHNFSVFSPVNFNWKTWRLWGNRNSPNGALISVMDSVWNGHMPFDYTLESGHNLWPFSDNRAAFGVVDQWNSNEILMRSNTNATGNGNGFWQYITNGRVRGQVPYQDGNVTATFKLWDSSTNPYLARNYVVHGVQANHPTGFPSSYRYWAADVYLDNTWARVVVGNAPTLEASTHREIQIPISWSSSSITVQLNLRAFPSGAQAYIFVVDQDNIPSQGFPLDVAPPSPPGEVRVE